MTGDGVHSDEMFDDDPMLAAFAGDLRAAADAAPPLVPGTALAAVLDGREAPPVPASLPAQPRPRRSTRLRWVVGGTVFGMTLGGLGVAGALPGPVQRQVSRAGHVVGVELPAGTDDEPDPTTTTSTSTTVSRGHLPPATTGEPEVDDDHGGVEGPGGDDHGGEPDAPGEGDERRSDDGDDHAKNGIEGRDTGANVSDGGRNDEGGRLESPSDGSDTGASGRGPDGSEENHHST